MALSVGIIGLPNVGKSTLLNALTHAGAEASNYPFCTIEKNVGMATVPDANLGRIEELLSPEEAIPTAIRFIDIAGLVEGASKGEGLGNMFLGHIRQVDAVLHVVRCFESGDVAPVYNEPDPVRDVEVVETELLLADLAAAESAFEKTKRVLNGGHKESKAETETMAACVDLLKKGRLLREEGFSEKERRIIDQARFLTLKPSLYLANTDESDPRGEGPLARALTKAKGADRVIPVAVQIEEEIAELSPEEGEAFLADLGIEAPGLNRVITGCYRLLDLLTFYTIANNKLRAWQVRKGSFAPEAAGKVHTDMEKGFIRAEVMELTDLIEHGSRAALIEKGLVHTVGKGYAVKDCDVLQFHFKA